MSSFSNLPFATRISNYMEISPFTVVNVCYMVKYRVISISTIFRVECFKFIQRLSHGKSRVCLPLLPSYSKSIISRLITPADAMLDAASIGSWALLMSDAWKLWAQLQWGKGASLLLAAVRCFLQAFVTIPGWVSIIHCKLRRMCSMVLFIRLTNERNLTK